MNKILLLILTLQTAASYGQTMIRRDVGIGGGISLHVVEQGEGEGEPVIFIHGVCNNFYSYQRQVPVFASRGFRAISYSRRYNAPNDNALQPNHSAIVEAEDLGRLLTALRIEKAHLMGHSYGACTALVFALKHPVLILSGGRTHGVAQYTDDELERLLPKATTRRLTFENATHMMWVEEPARSREAMLGFIRETSVALDR